MVMGRMRAVPPSRSTTSASQWAGYSCRSDAVCMGPRVRLASGIGARQPEGTEPGSWGTDRRPFLGTLHLWNTGLDNLKHLKGSITWLSAASTSAGPRASTPAPPPSSSGQPRPPGSP
ncbi:hypothetical protein GCM10022206_42790 [Streptomyces chiangmaiensis]